MYVINHQKKYIISMFPKSGCSTLRILHLYMSTDEREHGEKFFEDRHHGIQQRDDEQLHKEWAKYNDYAKVLVYRNPYERVVSLFFQKVCGVPAVTYRGEWYTEPNRLLHTMRTFAQYVDVLVSCRYHHDEHFCPQQVTGTLQDYDQVLDIRDILSIFRDIRPDLNEEVEKIFEKTGRTAWNQMRKLQAIPGAYASYDYYMDPDQLLPGKVVPCYSAMLTPQLCRKIQESYQDDFSI